MGYSEVRKGLFMATTQQRNVGQQRGQLWPGTLNPGDVFIAYNAGTAQNPRMGYIQTQQQMAIAELNALNLAQSGGNAGGGSQPAPKFSAVTRAKLRAARMRQLKAQKKAAKSATV